MNTRRVYFFVVILFVGCQLSPLQDPIVEVYWSIKEGKEEFGLSKTYKLDTSNLTISLSWPNPETGKEQHINRVDTLDQVEINNLLAELEHIRDSLDVSWRFPMDTLLDCRGCGRTQLYFYLKTKTGKLFHLQMPEKFPRRQLPVAVQKQLALFEKWVELKEQHLPILE